MKAVFAILSILIMMNGCIPAIATTLQPLPQPPTERLPIAQDNSKIPCAEIQARLSKFKDMNRQHEDSIATFLGEVMLKISGWYEALAPLEGQKNVLEAGTFEPIKTGSTKMEEVVNYAYDNADLLSTEIDNILLSLRDCSVTPIQK